MANIWSGFTDLELGLVGNRAHRRKSLRILGPAQAAKVMERIRDRQRTAQQGTW